MINCLAALCVRRHPFAAREQRGLNAVGAEVVDDGAVVAGDFAGEFAEVECQRDEFLARRQLYATDGSAQVRGQRLGCEWSFGWWQDAAPARLRWMVRSCGFDASVAAGKQAACNAARSANAGDAAVQRQTITAARFNMGFDTVLKVARPAMRQQFDKDWRIRAGLYGRVHRRWA